MRETSGEGDVCGRCGHARRTTVSTTHRLRRALRGKQPRVACGEPTDHGWTCPCRSRFHAA